ncbi:ABC transporter permease [Mesorhizobium sp. M0491]|uniref:ABC transporter permease n=1 Tax=Mesorhizobium sp. M0491 TaxID=2956950 RepID=UPI003337EC52
MSPDTLRRRFLETGGIVILLLVAVAAAAAIIEPRFLNRLNILNVLRNFSFLAVPAIGQMIVMTTGGFDLSVGATMALASVVTAAAMAAMPDAHGLQLLMPVALALACGACVGLVNGTLVARLSLSPFMVTLASLSIVAGITLYYTQGIPIYGVSDAFVDAIGRGQVLGLPPALLLAIAVIAIAIILQRRTALGRHFYAVGGNVGAARLSGVRTHRVLITAYVLSGLLAALTGVLITARIGSGQSTIGGTLGLETIAAAVIGGVSLRGGSGRAENVAMAALCLAIIANAMNLTQIDSKFQTLVLGSVLIGALAFDRIVQGRRANV